MNTKLINTLMHVKSSVFNTVFFVSRHQCCLTISPFRFHLSSPNTSHMSLLPFYSFYSTYSLSYNRKIIMILALKNDKIIRYIFVCVLQPGKVMVRFKLDQKTKFKREAPIHPQIDTVVSEKPDCKSCFSSLLTVPSCAY